MRLATLALMSTLFALPAARAHAQADTAIKDAEALRYRTLVLLQEAREADRRLGPDCVRLAARVAAIHPASDEADTRAARMALQDLHAEATLLGVAAGTVDDPARAPPWRSAMAATSAPLLIAGVALALRRFRKDVTQGERARNHLVRA